MNEKEFAAFEQELRALHQLANQDNQIPAISGADLMEQDLIPRDHVVRGVLPKGLSILGGAPKIGKSWMMLDLCLHVAKGQPMWGIPVKRGTAWYLALEDTNDRISQRLASITDDDVPRELMITTSDHHIDTTSDGFLQTIENFMAAYPDTCLIVIDTFQMIRGNRRDPSYGGDYADVHALKCIANKYAISMVLVHHLRKMTDPDPVNKLSGTTGLSGAADTLLVLEKSRRMEDVATLSCIGRDIQQRELELRFNPDNCTWAKFSDSAEHDGPSLPPEMLAFVEFMRHIGHYDGGNTELAEMFSTYSGTPIGAKGLKQKMNRWRCILSDCGISYHNYNNNGRRISVSYTDPSSL